MPTLTAGGGEPPIEQIKRVDLTPDDIRNMTDDELIATLESLRKSRETAAPRSGRPAKAGKGVVDQIIDDSDVGGDI